MIVGSMGDDKAYGGDGNNLVSLAGGSDVLVTGSGDDRMDGAKGFDTCDAGAGQPRGPLRGQAVAGR